MKKLTLLDTTLRDGELTAGVTFTRDDKITIASRLAAIGVDVIEVGVADASGSTTGDIREISAHVRTSALCVLAPSIEAIDAAGEALLGAASARIHVYQGASNHPESLARAEFMVRRARERSEAVEFTPLNGVHAPLDAVASIARAALRGGAMTISVADTAGSALPEEVSRRFDDLRTTVPELSGVCMSFHGHDDFGLATANSLAALRAGAGQLEVAVNGLGARAGNAALEEIVAILWEHGDTLGWSTRVSALELSSLSRLVEERSGMRVSDHKAVVGRMALWKAR